MLMQKSSKHGREYRRKWAKLIKCKSPEDVIAEISATLETARDKADKEAIVFRSVPLQVFYLPEARHLSPALFEPAEKVPAPFQLERLRAHGIPTVSDEVYEAAVEDLAEKRRLILALAQNDGWSWESVYLGKEA